MKGLNQAIYSSLTVLCCVLSYTGGLPASRMTALRFQPSRTQCCKLGELFAKKKLSCEFGTKFNVGHNSTAPYEKLKFVDKTLNSKISINEMMASAYIRKLMMKADRCSDDQLISYTTKCCGYRQRYYKELKLCAKYKNLRKSKRCVREVKQTYP